jgi:hypothetical protein
VLLVERRSGHLQSSRPNQPETNIRQLNLPDIWIAYYMAAIVIEIQPWIRASIHVAVAWNGLDSCFDLDVDLMLISK